MGFFSGLFKKKKGGTFVGNLIRGGVKQIPIVGAVYNTMFPAPDEAGESGFGSWLDRIL